MKRTREKDFAKKLLILTFEGATPLKMIKSKITTVTSYFSRRKHGF